MLKKYKKYILFINLILVLLFVNYAVFKKEQTLKKGNFILLELAPVDPRSLMQGDYMRLQYKIAQIRNFREEQGVSEIEKIPNKGYLVLQKNANNIGEKIRLQKNIKPLNQGEIPLKYHKNNRQIYLGAESYFFQEGNSDKYQKAKYGGLTVDEKGNSVLVGLYDADLKKIN